VIIAPSPRPSSRTVAQAAVTGREGILRVGCIRGGLRDSGPIGPFQVPANSDDSTPSCIYNFTPLAPCKEEMAGHS